MIRKVIEGGWYGMNLPGGHYAVSLRGQGTIETHSDFLKAPELVGTVCTDTPMFKIAGQDHDGTQNLEWVPGSSWLPVGPSYGVNAVCYDAAGQLHQGAPGYGSQGIRYIDNDGIHTGDETYARSGLIYEYTHRGDLTVGQGSDSGAIVIAPEGIFLLEPGDCRFIRFNADLATGRLAITIVKLAERKTVLLWLDRDEISAFPRISSPPIDRAAGPINTLKDQMSTPFIPDNEITRAQQILREVRADLHFGPNQDDLPYTKEVAARLGGSWGLNGKRGDPSNISHDILAFRQDPPNQPILVDILGDGGGANTAQFGILEYPQAAGAVWVAPGKPSGKPQDAPGSPATPPTDLTPLLAQLGALNALVGALTATVSKLSDRLGALENKPPVVAAPRAAKVTGKTRTSFGHQHVVELDVIYE